MSGDVTLIDPGDGAVSRLVRTATTLFDRPDFAPTALVGGLAVTIRLATVHRATVDVDTVSGGDGPERLALEYLGDAEAAAKGRIEIDGVKVDVIGTEPLPSTADSLPDDDLDRLFVLGHRWALESGSPITVSVVGADGTTMTASGLLTVATVPALVACKLHALADARGSRASKRESDALDLVRLVGDLVRSDREIDAFGAAPFDLAALVAAQLGRWFIDESLRTARLATLATVGQSPIDRADVATIGRLFVERLADS